MLVESSVVRGRLESRLGGQDGSLELRLLLGTSFRAAFSRSAKVRWFRDTYDDEIKDKSVPADREHPPSIVAHSFGTYILGNALLKYDWLRFDKVILCGSILPQNFPWDQLIERGQVQSVRNEYGVQDTWSGLVRWFVAGTGPSGRNGFNCTHERLEQERFEYTHSEYFNKGHMEAKWLPFLEAALPVIGRRRPPWTDQRQIGRGVCMLSNLL